MFKHKNSTVNVVAEQKNFSFMTPSLNNNKKDFILDAKNDGSFLRPENPGKKW